MVIRMLMLLCRINWRIIWNLREVRPCSWRLIWLNYNNKIWNLKIDCHKFYSNRLILIKIYKVATITHQIFHKIMKMNKTNNITMNLNIIIKVMHKGLIITLLNHHSTLTQDNNFTIVMNRDWLGTTIQSHRFHLCRLECNIISNQIWIMKELIIIIIIIIISLHHLYSQLNRSHYTNSTMLQFSWVLGSPYQQTLLNPILILSHTFTLIHIHTHTLHNMLNQFKQDLKVHNNNTNHNISTHNMYHNNSMHHSMHNHSMVARIVHLLYSL